MAVIPDRRRTGVSAELVLFPGCVDVVRDEEIEAAVPIEIGKRAARAPPARGDTRSIGHVRKTAATHVPIQCVAADAGDVHVDAAVVVVVARACTHTVLAMADT